MKADVGRYMFSLHCRQIQQDDNKQVWLFSESGKCTQLGFAASQLVPLLLKGASYNELLCDAAKRAQCHKSEINVMLSGLLRKLIDEEYIEHTYKTIPNRKYNIEQINTVRTSRTLVKVSVFSWIAASIIAHVLLIWGLKIMQQPLFDPFSLTITFSLLVIWICGHEYSHYLAARYVGFKNVTFGIIKRKLFCTVATEIPPQIGINDPSKRCLVSVAGMIYDSFFLSILTLAALIYSDTNEALLINTMLTFGALSLCLNASVIQGSDGANLVHHLFNLVEQVRHKSLRWTLSASKTFLLVNTLLLGFYLLLLIVKSDVILIHVQEHWPL